MKYILNVGNVGEVWRGNTKRKAVKEFSDWKHISKTAYGRAAKEPVILFESGEPIKEYNPPEAQA